MVHNKIILAFLLLTWASYSCKLKENEVKEESIQFAEQERISIDSIYLMLSKGKRIQYKELPGQFVYLRSDTVKGEYEARFISNSVVESINYVSYAGTKKDKIILDDFTYLLDNTLDPLSIKIYEITKIDKKYWVFLGNAESASGTGIQVTYFVMMELSKNKKVARCKEFESRFGSINSLVDYNTDGNLDYFKVVHSQKEKEYYLTVRSTQTNEQIGSGQLLLKYQLNDHFVILENLLSN